MESTARDPLESIVLMLRRCAPSGWARIVVRTVFETDGLSISEYDYVDVEGTVRWFDPDAASAAKIGRRLRAIREAARGSAWSRAELAIDPDGRYRFEIGYDD